MVSRHVSWSDRRISGETLVAGTPILKDLLENAPTSDTLTVVRIIGTLLFRYLISTTVMDSTSIVDVGIGVASIEAFDAGVAALPSPSVDTEFPPRGWLYVSSQEVAEQLHGSTGESIQVTPARFSFDLRAMRKIDKGRLFLVMNNTNLVVGGAMTVTGRVRALCKT